MKNFDVSINDFPINIGMVLDKKNLTGAGFKKAGFFSKSNIPIPQIQNDIIYWTKNCNLKCFGDEIDITANLDMSSGAHLMFGTSCYLFFNRKKLRMFVFQVIDNVSVSSFYFEEFGEVAKNKIGKRSNAYENIYPGKSNIWIDDNEILIMELAKSKRHVYLFWNLENIYSLMQKFS